MNNIDVSTTKGEALNCLEQDQEATAYIDGLDLEDPYYRIVCSSISQSRNAGGGRISDLENPSGLKTPPRSKRSAYSKGVVGGHFYVRAGTGQKGMPKCGEIISIGACEDPDCHRSLPKARTVKCHRYDCPICYHDANERMARSQADRLETFAFNFLEEYGESPGKPKHIVFSPSQKKWTRERVLSDSAKALDKELKRLCDFAFKDGFYALTAILHLEREKHKDGTDCPGKACTVPTSEHIWIWGVHYHCIGYGYLKNTKLVQAKFPGWNIMVIPEGKDDHGNTRYRDVYGTILYQGSHASIIYDAKTGKQSRKVVKHLGLINPRTYCRRLDHVEYERINCACGRPMKVFMPTATFQPDRSLDYGPMVEKREVFRYRFNQVHMTKFFRKREEKRAYDATNEGIKERARRLSAMFAEVRASNDLKDVKNES